MDNMEHDLNHSLIMVTGANGYLGGRVIELCKSEGINVAGCSRHKSDKPWLHKCDLLNTEDTKNFISRFNPRVIIHCAATVPKNDAGYSDMKSAQDNLKIVDNLLITKPEHIVFCSSMTIYDENTKIPAREEDIGKSLSLYAASKLAAEKRIFQTSVPATILRLPGLFGAPRKSGLLYNIISSFISGKHPALSKKFPLWSTMHVDDAAKLCLCASNKAPVSQVVINVGYSEPMSISDIVIRLAKIINIVPPRITSAPVFEMDLSRLKALEPSEMSFEKRLIEYIKWVRKEE
jgi:nucleoside-diphosphate-sugar epimerase